MRTKVLFSVLVVFFLLASCNMPAGITPVTQPPEDKPVSFDANAMATAVELTAAVRLTEIAGSVTPTFTSTPAPEATATFTSTPTFTPTSAAPVQCNPMITANVVANVRKGPDTVYDIVGSLAQGQAAGIVGRNDAYTWWYIDYPANSGSHAWVAGSVVTASCVPAVVQVVAAPPPPPTSVEASDSSSSNSNNNGGSSSGKPDLVAYAMQYYVVSGKTVQVMVTVRNAGNADASDFTVKWMANQELGGCHWDLTRLAAGKSKNLECEYTYTWGAVKYWSTLLVDSAGQITESDEGNNKQYYEVKLH